MKTAKRGEARGTASRDLEGRRAQQARREKKSLQEACTEGRHNLISLDPPWQPVEGRKKDKKKDQIRAACGPGERKNRRE